MNGMTLTVLQTPHSSVKQFTSTNSLHDLTSQLLGHGKRKNIHLRHIALLKSVNCYTHTHIKSIGSVCTTHPGKGNVKKGELLMFIHCCASAQ